MDVIFYSPLSGPVVPLEDVPDPVFAQRMAGDGLAIDPIDNRVLSPCGGKVTQVHRKRHAVTLVTDEGVELLIHIGIETVSLDGEGFQVRVSDGQRVSKGDLLIEFDADVIARKAKSLMTVVLVANNDRFHPTNLFQGLAEASRTPLFIVHIEDQPAEAVVPAVDRTLPRVESVPIVVEAEHGIHARPAAALAGTARRYKSVVEIVRPSGKAADAKSVVALLGLEIERGDSIRIVARGADAKEAVEALGLAARAAFGRTEEKPLAASTEKIVTKTAPASGPDEPGVLRGVLASPGLAIGQIAKLIRPVVQVEEYAVDSALEKQQLHKAIAATRSDIEAESAEAGESQGEILLAHRIILEDPMLVTEAENWIGQGKSAGWAWQAAARSCEERIRSLKSGLLAGRAADIEDVAVRVLWRLTGVQAQLPELTSQSILVAEDLPPSVLISLDRAKLAGFATVRGGPTSHVAILARSMGMPAVAGLPVAALALSEGEEIVLNGDDGLLETRPTSARLEKVRAVRSQREALRVESQKTAHQPAVTRDGTRIEIAANIGGAGEAREAVKMGADGIGLLRTEFLFLDRAEPPTEEEHLTEYLAIIGALGDRPLIIRTLDLGGDKLPSYFFPQIHEDNPSLGIRGVRLALERPDLYRDQLRAILRIGSRGQYRIMLPLVSGVEEVLDLRGVLTSLAQELGVSALPQMGIMVETPAAAMLADRFAAVADFFSVGSNDLTQYILAIDRGHPILGRKLDSLHPAVLRAISVTVEGASLHQRWVGVCGAMASEPAAVALLIGLGVSELSVSIPMVPEIKAQVRSLDLASCRKLAEQALELDTAAEVRALVKGAFPVLS